MESYYPMPQPGLSAKSCPIALSLDRVGEGGTILILRDAARGLTRFDQFQKSLGIAPNILSRRLRGLVEAGLLKKSRYSEHPPRDAYLLTERGRDFRPGTCGRCSPGAISISCRKATRSCWSTTPAASP